MAGLTVRVTGGEKAMAYLKEVQAGAATAGRARVFVGVAKRAFYGKFVERGTRGMRAQPFLGPALEAEKQHLKQAVAAALPKGGLAVDQAVISAANRIAGLARGKAPRATGALRGSIRVVVGGRVK